MKKLLIFAILLLLSLQCVNAEFIWPDTCEEKKAYSSCLVEMDFFESENKISTTYTINCVFINPTTNEVIFSISDFFPKDNFTHIDYSEEHYTSDRQKTGRGQERLFPCCQQQPINLSLNPDTYAKLQIKFTVYREISYPFFTEFPFDNFVLIEPLPTMFFDKANMYQDLQYQITSPPDYVFELDKKRLSETDKLCEYALDRYIPVKIEDGRTTSLSSKCQYNNAISTGDAIWKFVRTDDLILQFKYFVLLLSIILLISIYKLIKGSKLSFGIIELIFSTPLIGIYLFYKIAIIGMGLSWYEVSIGTALFLYFIAFLTYQLFLRKLLIKQWFHKAVFKIRTTNQKIIKKLKSVSWAKNVNRAKNKKRGKK